MKTTETQISPLPYEDRALQQQSITNKNKEMKTITQNFEARLGYDKTVGMFYKGGYVGKCLNADCLLGHFTATALEFMSMLDASEKSLVKSRIKRAFKSE